MERLIRYLYEYKDGKRIRNTGFVKVEEQEETAVIQIYGRGVPVAKERTLKIYLFFEEADIRIGIFMGEITSAQEAFGYKLRYTAEDVGGIERFQKIQGILLHTEASGDVRDYGAVWNDDEKRMDITKIIPEEKRKVTEETKKAQRSDDPKDEQNASEGNVEKEDKESEEVKVQNKDIIYKITRKELAGLPRKEWKLANNHFLLHGYYNYHHLISFEKDGKYWIGVPGLYFPEEQRAAGAFGFGQFMKPSEEEVDLEEYKIEDEEHFGYWCRPVGAVIRAGAKEMEYAKEIDRGREIYEGSNPAGEESVED